MSGAIQDIGQLREFLSVYNILTERCFNSCIDNFNERTPSNAEDSCLSKCIDKYMRVNRRLMIVFAEVAPQILFKQGSPAPSTAIISADSAVKKEVMCAVYGPHEATNRGKASEDGCSVSVQLSTAAFATLERKNRRRGDRKTTALARMLEKTFESVIVTSLFPRAQIDICCEIIQEDGSRLSSCINAASLALADAGIPMRGVVTSVTCSSVEGKPVVDISAREEMDTIPRLTLATVSGRDEVVLVEMENRVHMDHLSSLMAASHTASSSIHSCLHAALQQHLSQTRAIL